MARRKRRPRRSARRRFSGARCRRCGRLLSDPISISRGYGPRCWMLVRGGYSYEPRSTSIQKIPYKPVRPSPSLEISNSIKKGLLEGAVVYGLSAVSPPLGAVLVPSYEALDKIRLGLGLMKIATSFEKRETDVNRKRIYEALADASDPALDLFSEDISKEVAKRMVRIAQPIIIQVSKQTGVNNRVYTIMLENTISNGLCDGAGSLAQYAVGGILNV